MSQQELADKATQLAQQMATAHAALSSPTGPALPASISAAAHPAASFERGPSVASPAHFDAPVGLRITPPD